MAATPEAYDSLPYIDADISPSDRDTAERLIRQSLPHDHLRQLHSSLPILPEPHFSTLISQELARCAQGEPLRGGIDTTRYEAPDEPSPESDVDTWRASLKNAYTLSTYLSGRRANLSLLKEYGKNAWLIGNSELEGILKRLETEAAALKAETEDVNRRRKLAQHDSKAEISNLEETWKRGVGKIIEVQVATIQLKQELAERRRKAVA